MKNLRTLLFAALLILAGFSSCKSKHLINEKVESTDSIFTLKKVFRPLLIDSTGIANLLANHPEFSFHANEIKLFYEGRNYKSAWFNEYGIIEQGGFFMNLLDHFVDEGVNDTVLYYHELKQLYNIIADPQYDYAGADSVTANFELMLTAEFFVYAQKVWYGLSEKTTRDLSWYVERKTVPSVAILDSILSGGENAFTNFEPVNAQYPLLKNALKQYRKIADTPWDSLKLPESVKSIKPGNNYPVIAEIKHRLAILGDLSSIDSTDVYDSITVLGVQQFQSRHGLQPDGAMGDKFFREINATPAARIKQIEVNMERMRWMPALPESDYIIVNIPEYKLYAYENNIVVFDMKVVVGKASTSTTIFNDEMEYIVFSPYWVPPPSILNNEILPALKKDPNYLNKEHMEAVDPATKKVIDATTVDWKKYSKMPYIIRQKPGNNNALGWVKFIFPNEHNIYLHDTPSRNLFEKETRGFSHGCIRIAEPKKFATYLLRNDTIYTDKKIDSLYYLGKETYVKLETKVPVFIVYFTTRVDKNGLIYFSRDIYGHDAKLEKTLFVDEEAETIE